MVPTSTAESAFIEPPAAQLSQAISARQRNQRLVKQVLRDEVCSDFLQRLLKRKLTLATVHHGHGVLPVAGEQKDRLIGSPARLANSRPRFVMPAERERFSRPVATGSSAEARAPQS